jgi:5,6-dimethylbenzimidazole synthase
MTKEYDLLLNLLQYRSSVRRLKPDPLPDGYVEKVVEAGRWAMSGANSQPWEFIIVRDPKIKKELAEAYREINADYNFWMEQQRIPELRHPSFQLAEGENPYEKAENMKKRYRWEEVPALIAVIGDGRRQWGTVMGGHTFGRDQSHLTDGLANACMLMHLAAASLGLGTQWVTIHIQDPFKRILEVPDIYTFYLIIPIGYPAIEPKRGVRRELSEMLHYEKYDQSKYMSNAEVINYLAKLRGNTLEKYKIN